MNRQIQMMDGLTIIVEWTRSVMVLFAVVVAEGRLGFMTVAVVEQRMEQMDADGQVENCQKGKQLLKSWQMVVAADCSSHDQIAT